MLLWSLILFGLGISSMLDTIFNYGAVFHAVYSAMFMLVSLGMLIRVRTLKKRGQKEALERNNDRLRERMMEIRNSLDAIRNGEPIDQVIIK